jgi:hypothetical protein
MHKTTFGQGQVQVGEGQNGNSAPPNMTTLKNTLDSTHSSVLVDFLNELEWFVDTLMFMFFSIKNKFGDGDYQLDDYNSEEELNVDHADVDWDKVTLIDLCNLDIVSKIKYHAALHNKGHLFKLSDKLFRSTIPEDVAAVRQHPTKKTLKL